MCIRTYFNNLDIIVFCVGEPKQNCTIFFTMLYGIYSMVGSKYSMVGSPKSVKNLGITTERENSTSVNNTSVVLNVSRYFGCTILFN